MASASADGTARVWATTADGACAAVLRAPQSGACVAVRFGAVRTSGLVVVAAAGGAAHAFELGSCPSGAELAPARSFKGHAGGLNDLAIGENGEVLATASADKSVRLWKLRTGEHCRALPGGGDVLALSFSSSGAANLASATAKGALKVWGIVPRGAEAGMFAGGRR